MIVAEQPLQRIALGECVRLIGGQVFDSLALARLEARHLEAPITLWLVDAESEVGLLEQLPTEARVMLGLTPAPTLMAGREYQQWIRALQRKLCQQLDLPMPLAVPGEIPLSNMPQGDYPAVTMRQSARTTAAQILVIGASLGGLDAAKQLMDLLQWRDDTAIVLIQHIDAKMQISLPRVLTRHNTWSATLLRQEGTLLPGHLHIVPADQQVQFLAGGRYRCLEEAWTGQYRPDISQVLSQLAYHYGARLLSITLSGMGNDGSDVALQARQYGARLWAQSPASCSSASQPEAMCATGVVALVDTPEALARHANRLLEIGLGQMPAIK